jgi:hypothetical protein
VAFGKGVSYLRGSLHGAARMNRPRRNDGLQRIAWYEFQCCEQLIAVFADLVERRNVRVRERGGMLRVAKKPESSIRIASDRRREDTEGDGSSMARVSRAMELAHCTSTEAAKNVVLRQTPGHGARQL